MCNNKSLEERRRYEKLGRYAAKVLQHKPLEEIAKKEGISKDELMNALQSLKDINPTLYRRVFEY